MALLEALLGQTNPFAKWAGQNNNFLTALGAGIAQGPDLATGIGKGLGYAPNAKMLDLQAAQKLADQEKEKAQNEAFKQFLQQRRPDLVPLLDGGVSKGELFNEAFKQQGGASTAFAQDSQTRQQLAQQYGLSGDDATRYILTGELPGGNQSVRASVGPPVYMRSRRDPNVWGSFAPMSDGTLINQLTGEIANQDEWVPDPAAATGAKTGATVDAKTAAAARTALPSAEQMMAITNKAVGEVRNNSKGMNEWFSQWGPRGVYVNPGSDMGKFQAAASPTNAQAFMQARNMLKGGGQITDYEGRRAEDAMSRMQAALDKGDQDQYLRAVADFEQAVADGYQKLVAAAQGAYSAGGSAMPQAPAGGNRTSTGINYTVEP